MTDAAHLDPGTPRRTRIAGPRLRRIPIDLSRRTARVTGSTAGISRAAGAERRFIAEGRPTSLLGRMARPHEVASMIVCACSEHSSATTGTALRVDGGVLRYIA